VQIEPTTIVVIEDDSSQQAVLVTALEARGMRVHVASTGRESMRLMNAVRADLVVLDLGLPDVDGLELCRHLRVMTTAPIVVVTAQADDRRVVQALDTGADDYVTKPFAMSVLMARLRVALRHHAVASTLADDEVLEAGDLRLHTGAHQAMIGDEVLDLPARQFALLAVLVRNQGRVVTYGILAKALGTDESDPDERNVWRVNVSKIRKLIGEGPNRPVIRTEFNVGYRLEVPEGPLD
jgi:two-component system KDP operon response regulator KdpE